MTEPQYNELDWQCCPWCKAGHGFDAVERAGETLNCQSCGRLMYFGYGDEYDEETDECYIVPYVHPETR